MPGVINKNESVTADSCSLHMTSRQVVHARLFSERRAHVCYTRQTVLLLFEDVQIMFLEPSAIRLAQAHTQSPPRAHDT